MLSIIIPTLNDSIALEGTLQSIAPIKLKIELIIADGGSKDTTKELAVSYGAKLVQSDQGRGTQLAKGAKKAKGDWFLFLHADTHPGYGWEVAVQRFMDKPENRFNAAYFIFKLDHDVTQAKLIEKVVALRCQLFSLPYGDQGLLISREFYELIGGYAQIPIMEDLEILRTIKRSRLKPLPVVAKTSARKYQRDGYMRRCCKNLLLLSLFFFGVSPEILNKFYNT